MTRKDLLDKALSHIKEVEKMYHGDELKDFIKNRERLKPHLKKFISQFPNEFDASKFKVDTSSNFVGNSYIGYEDFGFEIQSKDNDGLWFSVNIKFNYSKLEWGAELRVPDNEIYNHGSFDFSECDDHQNLDEKGYKKMKALILVAFIDLKMI